MSPKKTNQTNNTLVQKSKIWRILSALNQEEQKKLVDFAQLPEHKLSQEARDMLSLLIEMTNLSADEAEIVTKNSFAEQLNATISDVNYWISELYQVVKRFVVFQEMKTGNDAYEIAFLFALKKRGLEKDTRSHLNKVKNVLNRPSPQSYHHHYLKFLLYEQYLMDKNRNSADSSHLDKCIYSLIAFFVENMLRLCIAVLNRKEIMPVEDEKFPVDVAAIFKFAEQCKQWQKYLPIELQDWAYKMFTSDDWEAYYNKIDTAIRNPANKLANYLVKDMSTHLMNRTIKAINEGKIVYAEKYLSTIKHLIKRKLILDNNILPHQRYISIITAGLLCKQSEWLDKFIKKYSKHLATKNKEAVKHLYSAQSYFVASKYKKAEKELNLIYKKDLNFNYDIHHKLNYKKVLMLTYFELGRDGLFDYEWTSFRAWLLQGKKTIPDARKQFYLNFLDAIEKIQYVDDLEEQRKIIKAVLSSDMPIGAFDRIWLEEKLEGRKKLPPSNK